MFQKSLRDLTFDDINSFCSTFREGVRVEYKSQMIKDIPKPVSALANTLGGVIVVGERGVFKD